MVDLPTLGRPTTAMCGSFVRRRRGRCGDASDCSKAVDAAEGPEGATQSASSTPVEGTAEVKGASEARASSSVQAPEPPKVQEHMNLAREARMRIKRGISWLA